MEQVARIAGVLPGAFLFYFMIAYVIHLMSVFVRALA